MRRVDEPRRSPSRRIMLARLLKEHSAQQVAPVKQNRPYRNPFPFPPHLRRTSNASPSFRSLSNSDFYRVASVGTSQTLSRGSAFQSNYARTRKKPWKT